MWTEIASSYGPFPFLLFPRRHALSLDLFGYAGEVMFACKN